MAKYLTIDIGNSSAKAALWEGSRMEGEAMWGDLKAHDIEHLAASCPGGVDFAAICAVAPDRYGLAEAARSLSRRFLEVGPDTPLPFSTSAYSSHATLGPDRIAALAGAQALMPGRELLVVDCGTAITYDRLSASGEFLGGNIAPGIGMRLRALHAFTSRLPEVESRVSSPLWGRSTAEAMQSGAIRGALAEIEYYRRKSPAGTALAITGGRAESIAGLLDSRPEIVDANLVLRGLIHIIAYNENR